MGCLIIALAFFAPRVLLFVGWITGFFITAHPWDTKMWPILGFIFLPFTTLCFGAVHVYNAGVFDGIWLIAMIFAVVFDIGTTHSSTPSSSSG